MARVSPRIVVINGGDGTVQAALTELYSVGHFGGSPPPVAVLPNGKTNLIALDLGAEGDPIKALERGVEPVGSVRERKSVVLGKSVSTCVVLCGRRTLRKITSLYTLLLNSSHTMCPYNLT